MKKKSRHSPAGKDKQVMKKILQNTGATAILISIAGIGGVLEKGANPVNVIVLALIGTVCCLIADKL